MKHVCNAYIPGTTKRQSDGSYDIGSGKLCGKPATVRGYYREGRRDRNGGTNHFDLGPLCSECFDRIRANRRPKRTFEDPLK